MYGTDPTERRALGTTGRRRRPTDRRQGYRTRRLIALTVLMGLLVALYYGAAWVVDRVAALRSTPAATSPKGPSMVVVGTEPLPFQPAGYLSAGDLDSDGKPEQIALSAPAAALRQIALVTGTGKGEKVVGQVMTVPDFPLQVRDLPGAPSILVQSGLLPASGQPTEIQVMGQPALEAAGGEPEMKAWRFDDTDGLVPVDYYALAAPQSPSTPDLILVDKYLNVLWRYQEGKLTGTYRVATGKHLQGPKPSAANQTVNYLTPTGRFTITFKAKGLPYYKENIPAGDPRNPLGTRWMGFDAYEGDRAMVWGIHGTNAPDEIGLWASDGCIRMLNKDVEALYEGVVQGKTALEIIDSRKP